MDAGSDRAGQLGHADGVGEPARSSTWAAAARALLAPVPAAAMVSALSLSAYHMGYYAPPPRFATVDLEAVVEAKQLMFAEVVARPGATDSDREKALAMVDGVASELSRAVSELVNECGCLLLVRNAVVGRADVDLTNELKAKLGVANVDVAGIRARLRGTSDVPGAQGGGRR